jgi:hypothetical protein
VLQGEGAAGAALEIALEGRGCVELLEIMIREEPLRLEFGSVRRLAGIVRV